MNDWNDAVGQFDGDDETVEVEVEPIKESVAAYKGVTAGGREVWLPKSQVLRKNKLPGSSVWVFEIPRWLAEEKDLI